MMQVILLMLTNGLETNGLVHACCLHKQQHLLKQSGIDFWQADAHQHVQVQLCVNMCTHAHFRPRSCA